MERTLVTRYVTIMWERSAVVATVDMSFTMTLNVLNKVSSDSVECISYSSSLYYA